jgi:hypothetical protein
MNPSRLTLTALILMTVTACAPAIVPSSSMSSQTPPANTTGEIDRQVALIDSNLGRYVRVDQDVTGESTEGAKVSGFREGDRFRKIDVEAYGETGRAATSYYLTTEGAPFFVRQTTSRYDHPLATDPPTVVSQATAMYYFSGGVILATLIDGKPTTNDGSLAQELNRTARHYADLLSAAAGATPSGSK